MSNYEVIRKELLDDIKAQESQEVLNLKEFDKKFNKLFEIVNFDMMNDSNDKFYGIFLSSCNRVKSYGIGAPFSHQMFNSKINLLINPLEIVKLEMNDVKLYLKHEVIHLVSEHYELVEKLSLQYPKMIPLLAADMIANDILQKESRDLHKNMLTVDRFNTTFNTDLTITNLGMAEVCEKISELAKNNPSLNKFINDHNAFVIEKAQEELEKELRKYKSNDDEDILAPPEDMDGDGGASGEGMPMDLEKLAEMLMASVMKVKGDMACIGEMLKNVVIDTMSQSRGKYPGGLMSLL